jgi:hypothetical protein
VSDLGVVGAQSRITHGPAWHRVMIILVKRALQKDQHRLSIDLSNHYPSPTCLTGTAVSTRTTPSPLSHHILHMHSDTKPPGQCGDGPHNRDVSSECTNCTDVNTTDCNSPATTQHLPLISVHRESISTMGWVWQYFPTYRLLRATLNRFLKRKFGDYDFCIDVSSPRPQGNAHCTF